MTATAKLFTHGRGQAVRLPKEFRFEGDEVGVRRIGARVILEPPDADAAMPWSEIDKLGDRSFMSGGRDQPEMPPGPVVFD